MAKAMIFRDKNWHNIPDTTQKIPVVIFDMYNKDRILGMVMVPDVTSKFEVAKVIENVKCDNPNSWDMEQVLLALAEHKNWEVYNCQDILELYA